MPNYKITVTATPNAAIIAYPHSSDVIYTTANITGTADITWTAASAELTRVVATYNGVDKIEIVNPADITQRIYSLDKLVPNAYFASSKLIDLSTEWFFEISLQENLNGDGILYAQGYSTTVNQRELVIEVLNGNDLYVTIGGTRYFLLLRNANRGGVWRIWKSAGRLYFENTALQSVPTVISGSVVYQDGGYRSTNTTSSIGAGFNGVSYIAGANLVATELDINGEIFDLVTTTKQTVFNSANSTINLVGNIDDARWVEFNG